MRPAIVAARQERLKNQRELRKEVNGRGLIIVNRSIEKKVSANHELSPCSVMNPRFETLSQKQVVTLFVKSSIGQLS